jgi:hypothetical protein
MIECVNNLFPAKQVPVKQASVKKAGNAGLSGITVFFSCRGQILNNKKTFSF